ncbi:PREDICTED: uncharacterized protein LOC107173440 [Diuraphis noxia]|uniref:uncharacterized protein LOC107173440 n=1 Tax=Diuraphis noxia TaxID=143948 RepID=UPI0007638353|nr:PREDICTED: uncharacterized protein LOC107173440 [Diuraphis noxia]
MAIPFVMPEPDPDTPMAHYLRIQNLLRELLTLLRRMPSRIIGDPSNYPYTNISLFSSDPPPYSEEVRDRLWVQQQQSSARAFHRRRLRERQQQREQQQPLLPDLVTSCGQAANPPPPPPPPPPPSPPQQQLQAQQLSAVDEDKIGRAVMLQVAVCPTCYYSKEGKLKVIAVAKLDENGKPIRWTNHRDDEEPVVVENKSSKVKRRIMSLLQPSKIESSVLTAMFVIIGWKMFIKQ